MLFTAGIFLLSLSLGALAQQYHYHTPTGNGVYGVDISHYNKITNFSALIHNHAHPLRFVFAKGTEGHGYVEEVFVHYWNEIIHNGAVPGVYHFYRSDASVEDNLSNIRKNIFGRVKFDHKKHLFAVDFETNYSHRNKAAMAHDLNEFLTKFNKEHGFKPFIYVSSSFWAANIGEAGHGHNFGDYPLWVAHWGPEHPLLPAAWKNYHVWQYSSIGRLPGVVGDIDLDWWQNPPDFVKHPEHHPPAHHPAHH